MNNKCPCVDCICKPICSGKEFGDFIIDCQLIADYYYFSTSEDFEARQKTIVEIVNPPWK